MFDSKVSCPSVHLCAIGGPDYVLTSKHPAARRPHWRFRRVPFAGDLVCPGVHLCLAITGTGEVPGFLHKPSEVLVSRDPTGGRTARHATPLTAGVGAVVSLACPSSWRCVAVDERDQVITTRAPGRGGTAWRPVNLGQGNTILTGVSCVTPTGCVAVDNGGASLTRAEGAFSGDAWDHAQVAAGSLGAVSCATGLCAATETSPGAYQSVVMLTPRVASRPR